jgi:hypothetical protein
MFSALSHFVFGAFSSHNQSDNIKTSNWKDKKLCFDLRPQDLELNRGEQLIGCFFPIEDVKGNQDELGILKVTNLRLIWVCLKKKRVNLSIGWRTVALTYEQNLKDTLCGNSTSLFVLSKYESTKYEFVFSRQSSQLDIWSSDGGSQTNWSAMSQLRRLSQEKAYIVSHLSPMYLDDPFDMVLKVWQAYKQTHLFRHCRSNINYLIVPRALNNGQLETTGLKLTDINRLPSEEIIEVISNIDQNESRVVKYTGTLLLTSIRLIWIDDTVHMRNLSIPYIRIESLKFKQGDRILVNTNDYLASSTQVEFQVQRSSTTGGNNNNIKSAKVIFEQIQNLYLLYRSKPRYGPESCDDCINFMSHLRPIELYFDTLDKSVMKELENFGPEANGRKVDKGSLKDRMKEDVENVIKSTNSSDDEVEKAERELNGYTTKLVNYLNERPLELDNELIYSTGKLCSSGWWRHINSVDAPERC